MRCSIIVLSTLLFASGISKAQSNRPLPPAPWTPFTSPSDSSLTGITSIATPAISLEGANLSFEVRIQNPNNKPIRCLATKFVAHMGIFGESCRTAPYPVYVDVNDGLGSIEIPANSTSAVKHAGNKEREESGRALGNIDLEFCSRDAWDLACGYDCANGKKYGDPWEESIPGGIKKYRCEANGEDQLLLSVTCNSGYVLDSQNNRCLIECGSGTRPNASFTNCEAITCAGGVAVGQSRSTQVYDLQGRNAGTSSEVCQLPGFYDAPVTECFSDFRKTGTNGCAHKSDFDEYYLTYHHPDCNNFSVANADVCIAAASRWCQANYGYPLGIIQQVAGENAGIGCFKSSPELVPNTYKYSYRDQLLDVPLVQGTATGFCNTLRGKAVGVLQENWGSTVTVSCLDEDASLFLPIAKTCTSEDLTCRQDASTACVRKGFNTGVVKNYWNTGLDVSCFNWDHSIYKEAPFVRK